MRLAVASSIGIWLYDAQTGNELALLTSDISRVVFRPDGQTFVSGSGDGTVLLWESTPIPAKSKRSTADANNDRIVNQRHSILMSEGFPNRAPSAVRALSESRLFG